VDIRTKLVFALVAVALGSMLAFGAVMYGEVKHQVQESTAEQLGSLADARKEDLEKVIAGWRERVQLIASRTQLRFSLRDHNESDDPTAAERIDRILEDAQAAVRTVAALAVYDAAGDLVADAGNAADTGTRADSTLTDLMGRAMPRLSGLPEAPGEIRFQGASFSEDGVPRVGFVTRLVLDGERLGTLYVLLKAQALIDLTVNYRGLGDTGEVLIVKQDADGGVSTLHPVRHKVHGASGPVPLEGADQPGLRALDQQEGLFVEGLVDYRGEPVWAATRWLPETGWGLVVKFDDAEEKAVIAEFRRKMTNLGLSLAAFAILIGVVLGIRFANPIHSLAEVANRIREGELRARAKVTSEDEVGLLARMFNDMADELEERMTLLNEFKTFFDYSLDLLCIAGTDGYFKMTNPAFERTLGWTQQELIAEPFMSLVHPDDAKATWQVIEKLAEGIPVVSFVNRFRCKDGTWKYLSWTAHPDPETGLMYSVARETSRPSA
jgi:PAS domain S-box-containing protein